AGQMAVTLLLNDRAGGFVAGGRIPMAAPVVDIETGRFDAGEAADLAVSTKTLAQVFVLFGQGDGGFAAPLALPSPLSPQQLAVGDLDEDGDDDIACTSNAGTNDAVGVILSRGDGSFEPPARYGALGTTVELLIDDLTGDGDADLAACTTEFLFGRWLMLLEGRGDGSFGPYSGIAGNNCPDVAFGQLDGDGRLDMVAGANLDDQLSIVPGTGDGFFGRAQGLSMDDGHASGRPQLVAVADLDGDGLQDLAVGMGNTLEPRIDILLGDGALGLLPPIVLPIAAAGTDLAALDLDQDGDADLLATLTNASLLVRLNDGRGGFATSDSYQTLPSPVALATGLLDADALLDVVVATSGGTGSGVVHVYLGAGGGALQEPLSFETGVVQTGLAVADLDQDGDDDVAVSASSNALVWLENDGAGFLSAGGSLPTVSTNPAGVAAADVDADGIMDLVGACTSTSPYSGHGSLAWLRGAGGGLFEPALLVDAPMGMEGLVAQDLDGDGRPDFAAPCLDDIVATVLNRSGPWNDLDHALAGGLGLPKLVGEGPLVAGTPFRITLTDSRPSSLVSLFLGLSPLDAPFKGGVLVPAPLLKLILATDAAGDLELAGNWPPGPSGLELLMQYWFADPAGPVGFAASNALSATIP
ncbi:MAG TPA: VCBS repeat-containing protein, partial [Planctomycetota bacterium]|nr:VCBS repeat-containing protein [Planctomycetota bacterium]